MYMYLSDSGNWSIHSSTSTYPCRAADLRSYTLDTPITRTNGDTEDNLERSINVAIFGLWEETRVQGNTHRGRSWSNFWKNPNQFSLKPHLLYLYLSAPGKSLNLIQYFSELWRNPDWIKMSLCADKCDQTETFKNRQIKTLSFFVFSYEHLQ